MCYNDLASHLEEVAVVRWGTGHENMVGFRRYRRFPQPVSIHLIGLAASAYERGDLRVSIRSVPA